jgi:hypothetical protein
MNFDKSDPLAIAIANHEAMQAEVRRRAPAIGAAVFPGCFWSATITSTYLSDVSLNPEPCDLALVEKRVRDKRSPEVCYLCPWCSTDMPKSYAKNRYGNAVKHLVNKHLSLWEQLPLDVRLQFAEGSSKLVDAVRWRDLLGIDQALFPSAGRPAPQPASGSGPADGADRPAPLATGVTPVAAAVSAGVPPSVMSAPPAKRRRAASRFRAAGAAQLSATTGSPPPKAPRKKTGNAAAQHLAAQVAARASLAPAAVPSVPTAAPATAAGPSRPASLPSPALPAQSLPPAPALATVLAEQRSPVLSPAALLRAAAQLSSTASRTRPGEHTSVAARPPQQWTKRRRGFEPPPQRWVAPTGKRSCPGRPL